MSSCCLALYHFFPLSLNKLWVEFGVDQNRKYLPIHKIVYSLGEETCRALPIWFALTGCDRKSIFSGRGKKTAWKYGRFFQKLQKPLSGTYFHVSIHYALHCFHFPFLCFNFKYWTNKHQLNIFWYNIVCILFIIYFICQNEREKNVDL